MGEILTPLIQKWLGSIIRTGLTALGTYLVTQGMISQDDNMTLMGTAPVVLSVLWSLYQKYRVTVAKAILRQLPAGVSNAEVQAEAAKYTATERLALALKDGTSL